MNTAIESLQQLRARLFDDALLWVTLAATPGVALGISRMVVIGWRPIMTVHLLVLLLLWGTWLGRRHIPYLYRVLILLLVASVTCIGGLIQFGPIATGMVYLVLIGFVAVLFLESQLAWSIIIANGVAMLLVGVVASLKGLQFTLDYELYSHHPLIWVNIVWSVCAYTVVLAIVTQRMVREVLAREQIARHLGERQQKIAAHIQGVLYQYLLRRDGSSGFPYASDGTQRLFGIDPDSLKTDGQSAFSLIHPDDVGYVRRRIIESAQTLAPNHDTFRVLHPERGLIWVERDSTPERLPNGDTLWHGFMRDVTERKRSEMALLEAKEQAEAASRAKSAFLANMSHELRTPLNSIIGFAQILGVSQHATAMAPSAQEAVRHILGSGRHLLQLINEVLDLARIEAGRLDLVLAPMALRSVLTEAVSLSRPAAQERQIALRSLCGSLIDLEIYADATRVRQIILNLISNAIKYNRLGGEVVVECLIQGERLRLVVIDQGKGIPLEQQSLLFLPFQRLGTERSTIEGTGIGLVVSKLLAEAMGGEIGLKSEVGVGSRFWVELPLYQTAPIPAAVAAPLPIPPPPAMTQWATSSATILYIEDHAVNLELMRHIFRRLPNWKLQCAENAEVGLIQIRTAHPDLVLMDINLPGMSGLEALQQLRQQPYGADLPIIAVSASARVEEIEEGIRAGFDAYLTKPFEVEELLTQIKRLLEREPR